MKCRPCSILFRLICSIGFCFKSNLDHKSGQCVHLSFFLLVINKNRHFFLLCLHIFTPLNIFNQKAFLRFCFFITRGIYKACQVHLRDFGCCATLINNRITHCAFRTIAPVKSISVALFNIATSIFLTFFPLQSG